MARLLEGLLSEIPSVPTLLADGTYYRAFDTGEVFRLVNDVWVSLYTVGGIGVGATTSILVDFSTETLSDDGAEHTFTKTLVLPAGGWEVDFLMQPILSDGEDENGYVYWGVVYDNPDAIVFATGGNIQQSQLMLRNLGDPLGNWGDVSVSNLYSRMRVKDSIEQSEDNVAMMHFNVYCTVPTTFTVSYEVAPTPTPPYTPVLYPGFAYMRATSLWP